MLVKNLFKKNKQEEFYIYAETAFHHEGDFNYLIKLIDEAAVAGADGIKFQVLLKPEAVYSFTSSFFRKAKKWCFSEKQWLYAIDYAKRKNLEVIILPIDTESCDFISRYRRKISAVEVHSICFNDYFMLKKINQTKLPVILGVGGRVPEEIKYARTTLEKCRRIILMYGFQGFPTKSAELDLSKIQSYGTLYDNVVMGYADHTAYDDTYGNSLIDYAYILGARMFEKHITLNKGEKRIDSQSAVSSRDIKLMIKRLKMLRQILRGRNKTILGKAEQTYREREKQIVFGNNFSKGYQLQLADLKYMVVDKHSDFQQKDIKKIAGKILVRDVKQATPVRHRDIQSRA